MLDTNFQRGVLAVFGSILVQVSVGENNLLGFLYPYFVAYFRIHNPGLQMEQMRFLPMYWVLAFVWGCPLGVYCFTILGVRKTYLLFITSFGLVQWFGSYITNFYVFSFLYGLTGGTCQGALLVLPLYVCWRYFTPEYKSRVSGLVLSAYAISPLFTSILALWAINPNNEKQTLKGEDGRNYFGDAVALRVPYFLRLFGVICALIGYIGCFCVWEPLYVESDGTGPSAYEMALLGQDNKGAGASTEEVKKKIEAEKKKQLEDQIQNVSKVNFSELRTIFGIVEFRLLFLIMTLCYLFPNLMNFCFKSIGLQYLQNDAYVTLVGSLAAIVNAVSRLAVGILYDKFGFLRVELVIIGLEIVTSLGFIIFAHYYSTYMLGVCAFEVTYGGQLGMYPLVCDRIFGKKGAMYYAYLFSAFTIALLVSLNAYSFLSGLFNQFAPFLFVAIASAISLPAVFKIGAIEAAIREKKPILE